MQLALGRYSENKYVYKIVFPAGRKHLCVKKTTARKNKTINNEHGGARERETDRRKEESIDTRDK